MVKFLIRVIGQIYLVLHYTKRLLAFTGGLVGLIALRRWLRRRRAEDLTGRVVLITGSSRGLGFCLAQTLAREGCRLIICARDRVEVEQARQELVALGAEVEAVVCDVGNREQVDALVAQAQQRFGHIDILINNAGILQVGPLANLTLDDFESTMDVIYWGVVYPTLAVLPAMRARGNGHIVNVTSVGGRVSVPHLLPYSGAKFAAVGFSEGLRAELAGTGVKVTTILPGLMRTGSYYNAFFKGQASKEYAWFSLGGGLPLLTISAENAARQIVEAIRYGESERTLGLPAQLLARLHGLFPGATSDLLGLAGRLIQPGSGPRTDPVKGIVAEEQLPPFSRWLIRRLTVLSRRAAHRLHQFVTLPGDDSEGER